MCLGYFILCGLILFWRLTCTRDYAICPNSSSNPIWKWGKQFPVFSSGCILNLHDFWKNNSPGSEITLVNLFHNSMYVALEDGSYWQGPILFFLIVFSVLWVFIYTLRHFCQLPDEKTGGQVGWGSWFRPPMNTMESDPQNRGSADPTTCGYIGCSLYLTSPFSFSEKVFIF